MQALSPFARLLKVEQHMNSRAAYLRAVTVHSKGAESENGGCRDDRCADDEAGLQLLAAFCCALCRRA